MSIRIEVDDPLRPPVRQLILEHLHSEMALSPPESVQALRPEALTAANVTFWTAWQGDELVGCCALRELDPEHGEVKTMRTREAFRGRGVGRALLENLIRVARARGLERLSLETGTTEDFEPARRLYRRLGFVESGPFGDYSEGPHSFFMAKVLGHVGLGPALPDQDHIAKL